MHSTDDKLRVFSAGTLRTNSIDAVVLATSPTLGKVCMPTTSDVGNVDSLSTLAAYSDYFIF